MKHTLFLQDVPHEVWLKRVGRGYRLLSEFGEHAIADIPGAVVAADGDNVYIHLNGTAYSLRYQCAVARFAEETADDQDYLSRAPMPGSVISVAVQAQEKVSAGKTLLVIESMKLETAIKAPRDGIVEHIHVKVGQTFDRDAVLVSLARPQDAPH